VNQQLGHGLASFWDVGIDSVDDDLHAVGPLCGEIPVKFLTKSPFSERKGVFCCAPEGALYRYPKFTQGTVFMADSIQEKVKDIIVEQLGVNAEQVVPEAKFIEDLGADSLDTVELVMAFEEEFEIEVPDEDAEKLQTVGDVYKYVEEKQGA